MHQTIQTTLLLLAAPALALAVPHAIDAAAPAATFNPDVRGQAVPDNALTSGIYQQGRAGALAVSTGTSIRGVAGGLDADTYDWRTRNQGPRPATIDYLRQARDHQADLIFTVNIRGLSQPDPNNPGQRMLYDTSIPTLTQMAADWVRYTNRIVQTYRQGDTITDPRDRAILDSLQWSSSVYGDQWDKLLAPGEAATPKVQYWEIGNEPRVSLGSYADNSYTFQTYSDATHKNDYAARYASITAAMKGEDPSILVGPCLQNGWSASSERALLDSLLKPQSNGQLLPIDFISYHPYDKALGSATTPADEETALNGIYANQLTYKQNLVNVIVADGRDPARIKLLATETNVSNWPSNDTPNEARMSHALGTVEEVFTFARLGLTAASYWVYPISRYYGTVYPVDLAFQGLQQHMGDQLLDTVSQTNLRLYTTRNSRTGEVAVWGLNFSNTQDATQELALRNVDPSKPVTLWILHNPNGPTTLDTSNLDPSMPGGPTSTVAWTSTTLDPNQLSDYMLTLPASTLSVLIFTALPEPSTGACAIVAGATLLVRRRGRR